MALKITTGTVTFLRVHDLRTGFGPADDHLEGEVVFKLSSDEDRGLGFELRDDAAGPARHGMLDLLRDAFNHGWTVTVEYNVPAGKIHGTAIRISLTRPRLPQRAQQVPAVVQVGPTDAGP